MDINDPRHFKTTDRKFAHALMTAGCRFAPQVDGGPATCSYTPAKLRSMRLLPERGVDPAIFEKTASDAFDRKVTGDVIYVFIRDSVFDEAQKAWDEMADEHQKAHDDRRDPDIPIISARVAMQVLYLHRMNERPLLKTPFFNEPLFTITEEKVAEIPLANKPAPRVKTTGSAKTWSRNCSQETREALGLPPSLIKRKAVAA